MEKKNWISVNDKLPQTTYENTGNGSYISQTVLVTDGATCDVGHYDELGFWETYSTYGYLPAKDVTHWMPLPETPKD